MPGSHTSGVSASSMGMQSSVAESMGADKDDDEQVGGNGGAKTKAGVEEAIWGVLFTLSKEKPEESKAGVVIFYLIEFIQLSIFLLSPRWDWNINFDSTFWRWFRRFQLEVPFTSLSYELWVGIFYVLCAVLCFCVALCTYTAISFKTGNFPYVWPVKVLRVFCSVFFHLFYVSSLDIFLVALLCLNHDVYAHGHEEHVLGAAVEKPEIHEYKGAVHAFPEQQCLSLPHAIHGFIAIIMIIVFMTIAFLLTISENSQDIFCEELWGSQDSIHHMRFFFCKTIIPMAAGFLMDWKKLVSLFFLVFYFIPLYDQLNWQPFLHPIANNLNAACTGVLFWGSVILVAKMYRTTDQDQSHLLTDIGLYSLPFIFFFFLVLNAARLHMFRRRSIKFLNKVRFLKSNDPHIQPEDIAKNMLDNNFKFGYPFEVEVMSRIGSGAEHHPEAHEDLLVASEAILLAGMAQFPEVPLLQVFYGSFLIEIRHDLSRGIGYFERARSMRPDPRVRFMIFVRDRERTQKAQGDSTGEGAMDLVSYVEFQNNFAQLIKAHRNALRANRRFWRLLVHHEIHFRSLSDAFLSMDETELKATKTYRAVLERYPRSVKILRAYASFLEEVRDDPWGARKHNDEAAKLEEAGADGGDEDGAEGRVLVNDKLDSVCVISQTGVLKVVNKRLLKLFGYRRQEDLVGKNVSTLMPPPYSQQHNTYLKRYMATGTPHILNIRQKLEAKHKKGHCFRVNLMVSKVESGGEVNFMGVMREMLEDETAVASLTPAGQVRSTNKLLLEMLGIEDEADFVGKNFRTVVGAMHAEALQEVLTHVVKTGEEVERFFEARHRAGKVLPASFSFAVEKSDVLGVLVKVTNLADSVGMITIDDVGQIHQANGFISKIFGWKTEELTRMNIAQLMPRPYSRFHAQYLANFRRTGVAKVLGDKRGRVVSGLHRDGRVFSLHMEIQEIKESETDAAGGGGGAAAAGALSGKRLFSGRMLLSASDAPDHRCMRLRMSDDGDIMSFSDTGEELFGLVTNDHAGNPIESILCWPDGTFENLLDCLLSIPNHTRGTPTPKHHIGKIMEGNPPMLTLCLCAGDEDMVKVIVEAEPCDEPHTVELVVWRASALEGVVSIDAVGRVTEASLGAGLLLGYREHELIGNDVNVLMPSKVARHHASFLARFKDAQSRKMVGTRRVVDAMHRDGTTLRLALEVSDAELPKNPALITEGGTAFTARLTLTLEECSAYPKTVVNDPTGDDGRDAAKAAAHAKFKLNPEIPAHRASSRSSGRSRTLSGRLASGRTSQASEGGGGGFAGMRSASALGRRAAPGIEIDPVHLTSVAALWDSFSEDMEGNGKRILRRLFEITPNSRALFSFASVEELDSDPRYVSHAVNIMRSIERIVASMDNPDGMADLLDTLGLSHAGHGVDPTMFDSMGVAITDTLSAELGAEHFTEDRREAWRAVYGSCAARIKFHLPERERNRGSAAAAALGAAGLSATATTSGLYGQPIMEAYAGGAGERLSQPPSQGPQQALAAAPPHPMPPGWTPESGAAGCPFVSSSRAAASLGPQQQQQALPPPECPAHARLAAAAAAAAASSSSSSPASAVPPPECPAHARLAKASSEDESGAAFSASASAAPKKEWEEFDPEVVARARRGHCLFFADPDEDVPEPGAWVGPRPPSAAGSGGDSGDSAAVGGGGGCLFADAMNRPPVKLPLKYERILREQRLAEQAAELRRASSASSKSRRSSGRGGVAAAFEALQARLSSASAAPARSPSSRAPSRASSSSSSADAAAVVATTTSAGPVTESFDGGAAHPVAKPPNKGVSWGNLKKSIATGAHGAGADGEAHHAHAHARIAEEEDDEQEGGVDRDSSFRLAKSFAHAVTEPPATELAVANPSQMLKAVEEDDEGDLKDAEDLTRKHDAEFQRARRFRQVLKLLNSLQMRKALETLRKRTRALLVAMAVAYVACFITTMVSLSALEVKFDRLPRCGDLLELSQSAGLYSAVMLAMQRTPPVNFTTTLPLLASYLREGSAKMDENLHGIFLGFEGTLELPAAPLANAISAPGTQVEQYWYANASLGGRGGVFFNRTTSLWQMGRSFSTKARVLGHALETSKALADASLASTDTSSEGLYLSQNGPRTLYAALVGVLRLERDALLETVNETVTAQIATTLALVATFVLALNNFKRMLDGVAHARVQLLMVFLVIPRPAVVKLATKSTKLQIAGDYDGEDDGDDEDEEWADRAKKALEKGDGNEDEAGKPKPAPGSKLAMAVFDAAAKAGRESTGGINGPAVKRGSLNRFGRVSQMSINRLRNMGTLLKLNQIAPIGANAEGQLKIHTKGRKLDTAGSASYFFLLPIIAWGVLTVTIYGVSCYLLQGADMGLRHIEATSTCHAAATRVRFFAAQVVITAASNSPATVTNGYRQNLRGEAASLLKLHDGIIHGDASLGIASALYVSQDRNDLLYGEGCLRTEEECRPASDPYYTATNYGLDAMVRKYVEAAQLFAAEPAAALNTSNPHFDFIWDVGKTDLFDALHTSEGLFMTEAISPIQTAIILQVAILPLLMAGKLAFMVKLFKPWLQRTMHETKRVAELLAQLPKELNVSHLIVESMDMKQDQKDALLGKKPKAQKNDGKAKDKK